MANRQGLKKSNDLVFGEDNLSVEMPLAIIFFFSFLKPNWTKTMKLLA